MKKILVSLMIALTVGASSVSSASNKITSATKSEGGDSFQAKVFVRSESMKLDVFVEPAENATLMIRFLDSKGRTLATKRVSNSENVSGVRFDVSDLKDGTYQVEITKGTARQVVKVELETNFQPQRSLFLQ